MSNLGNRTVLLPKNDAFWHRAAARIGIHGIAQPNKVLHPVTLSKEVGRNFKDYTEMATISERRPTTN